MKAIVDLAVYTLSPVLFVLLLGGAVLGLVVGVTLVVDSARVFQWNQRLNRWYSTRQGLRPLEQPIDLKRLIYRWHRVAGVLVFAGALFTLDVLAFSYRTGALVRAFAPIGSPAVLAIFFETLRIILIVGNVAGLLAAVVLCFRPSLLKGLEAVADQHYSARAATRPLEVMRYQPDDLVRARPKLVGTFVTIGSLYVLFALGLLLL